MARYTLRRLLAAVPILLATSMLCFGLMRLAPGGPLAGLDPRIRGTDRARLEKSLGLDRPLPEQYLRWLGGALRGDLGRSLVTGERVSSMLAARLPATIELMGAALTLSLVLGVGIGIAGATRPGSWLDRMLGALSIAGLSIPVFWLGVLAILLFSVRLGWLPSSGRETLGAPFSLLDRLRHLILPAAVLATVQLPQWSRHMRASLLEVIGEPHVRAARARGLTERQVLLHHAVRPALLPVVTLVGLQVPTLFTGAIITETLFAWPGIGRLFYEGAHRFDYTRLMGILLVGSALIVLGNLAADLVNARLDPRIRLEGSE